MFNSKILKTIFATSTLILSYDASAVVTFANCPTLQPLPVTSFLPAAMLPIKNAQTAFDAGMNVVVKEAVNTAAIIQAQAASDAFSSVMKNLMQVSQSQSQTEIEIEREYAELKLSYESELENQKAQLEDMLFPGDPSMMPPAPGEVRVIDPNSPSYKFIRNMCSAGKMQQMLVSKKVRDKGVMDINRRSQKIVSNIQAVASISSAAKKSVDMHYELFCSDGDRTNALCDEASAAPNADLEAYAFLYPSGSTAQSTTYQTIYTYSPVESLAAYQYIRNLTGTLYITPPSPDELSDPRKSRSVAAYKQLVSALSMSASALLDIAQTREPVNNEGVIMGELDVLGYLINEAKSPEAVRVVRSSSMNGKLIELQKQMAISQRLRLLKLKKLDQARLLKATSVALDNTLYSLTD